MSFLTQEIGNFLEYIEKKVIKHQDFIFIGIDWLILNSIKVYFLGWHEMERSEGLLSLPGCGLASYVFHLEQSD